MIMKKTAKNKLIIFSIIFILLIPVSFSDGGCIKITDDVFVQLSAVPIAPKVNEQASFLISFGSNDGLLNKRINGTLKIVKSDKTVFEKKFDIQVGILDLKYTFKDTGFYEMYIDFAMNGKDYHPEDFAMEVVESKKNSAQNMIFLIAGAAIGAAFTLLIGKKGKK